MDQESQPAGWWDALFAAQTDPARHLRRVLDLLPAEVLAFLSERGPRVLVWGCGVETPTRVFTESFSKCDVAGLEFSPVAITRARGAHPDGRYLLSDNGEVPRAYEVTLALDQLHHFADPRERLNHLLATCRDVCVVTVPLGEYPLGPFTRSQFRTESLPDGHGKFTSILTHEFTDPDRGRMLLAVYASAEFRRTHGRSDRANSEQDKWDAYYTGLGEAEETPALQTFGSEFATVLDELLPVGASVLEAGCGAGFQSLALAREGQLKVSMMDISPQALDAARRLFARSGLEADAHLGDVFAAGEVGHDLVFNAGVLEHYTLDQQAAFLGGMASRTKKYVLVLVPNRLCYWYWLWRVQQSRHANWPYGKECPMADMSAAFRAAGLTFLGRAFVGASWTEDLIANVQNLPDALRDEVLAVHRSGVADPAQRCYLMAALGCVGEAPAQVPNRWAVGADADEMRLAEVTAGLADALALRLAGESQLRTVETRLSESQKQKHAVDVELSEANAELAAFRSFRASATYRLADRLQRLRVKLAPPHSCRAKTCRGVLNLARAAVRPIGRLRSPAAAPPPAGLSSIIDRAAASAKRTVVFLPSLAWSETLFQRPHHLAREFANLGHTVVFDVTGTDENLRGVKEVLPNLFLYNGDPTHLQALKNPLLWAFTYNFDMVDRFGPDATAVYDWIDDLAVFPHDQVTLRRNHDRALREAALVTCVARGLQRAALAVRPDAVYLPNAAEYDRFADTTVTPAADPRLRRIATTGRPIAGYYGALARWFDFDLLAAVADLRPDWQFVLIGPDLDNSTPGQEALQRPNVLWLGPREYRTLPGYLEYFDVATIPFVINDITLATSPLKLYEYFSAGKPVITTPMPECMAYREVHIAGTAEEFSRALDAARVESGDRAFRQRVRKLGEANSWATRVREVAALLEPAPAPRRAA